MTLPPLAPDTALFLDIDGTLAEFKDRPEDVRVPATLRETLGALQQKLHGAVALVSGRELSDVDRLFAPLKLAAAGDHGAEARFTADGPAQIFAPPAVRAALAAVFAEVQSHLAASSRVRPEKKSFSIAFHYRGAEAEETRLRDIVGAALAPHETVLQLLDGELCLDVRPRAEHKGKVIERFLAVTPFRGRVPLYIGDAGTDEDGFAAALARGGRAIRVTNQQQRPTVATEALASPAELRDWLARSAAALA